MSDINQRICNFIKTEWVASSESCRSFALDHNIDEKTVRKIVRPEGYRIPVKTLFKICEAREISLSYFFSLIDS
jgi:hypothetical protein